LIGNGGNRHQETTMQRKMCLLAFVTATGLAVTGHSAIAASAAYPSAQASQRVSGGHYRTVASGGEASGGQDSADHADSDQAKAGGQSAAKGEVGSGQKVGGTGQGGTEQGGAGTAAKDQGPAAANKAVTNHVHGKEVGTGVGSSQATPQETK
jgi:hypothetical protein